MSGLLFLTAEDFSIQRGVKGPVLGHSIPGYALILFYSTACEHCQKLIPIFKSLPGSVHGCQFGMINIQTNRSCYLMSKETIEPLTYVPYIALYNNGKPVIKYQGPHAKQEIVNFVVEVANNIQKRQQFSREKVKQDENTKIPAYTVGIPVCSGSVCYLDMSTAYLNTRTTPNN